MSNLSRRSLVSTAAALPALAVPAAALPAPTGRTRIAELWDEYQELREEYAGLRREVKRLEAEVDQQLAAPTYN